VVSTKGQTVIPKEIRQAAGIKDGTKLAWILREGELKVVVIPENSLKASFGILKDSGYTFDDFMQERDQERAHERMLENR
jgi:AbrB family looped-hinge helix DNA binding protein